MEKGSKKAQSAGQKAAETRKRNLALGITKKKEETKTRGAKAIQIGKLKFTKLEESNFACVSIKTPVKIYIHRSLSAVYISPERVEIEKA